MGMYNSSLAVQDAFVSLVQTMGEAGQYGYCHLPLLKIEKTNRRLSHYVFFSVLLIVSHRCVTQVSCMSMICVYSAVRIPLVLNCAI